MNYQDRYTNRNGLKFELNWSGVSRNGRNETYEINFFAIPRELIQKNNSSLKFDFIVTGEFIHDNELADISGEFIFQYGLFEFKRWLNEINELKLISDKMIIKNGSYSEPEIRNGKLSLPTNDEDDERLQRIAEEFILKSLYNNRKREKITKEELEQKCFVPNYIFNYTYDQLNESGYINENNYQLTPGGIAYYKNTTKFDLPQNKFSKTVFVAQAFADDMKTFFEEVYSPIIFDEFKLNPILISNEEFDENIDAEILNQIKQCKFMICDLTYMRPSVYFEAGYALARGVKIIFTCRNDHNSDELNFDSNKFKVHFDVRNRKISWWDEDNLEDFKKELNERIKQFLNLQNLNN